MTSHLKSWDGLSKPTCQQDKIKNQSSSKTFIDPGAPNNADTGYGKQKSLHHNKDTAVSADLPRSAGSEKIYPSIANYKKGTHR
jgi:hypothetical protein